MSRIVGLRGREVLDSRGNPTVEVLVVLEDGSAGRGTVPSGASRGRSEALELRDGDSKRYLGNGVLRAVENVNRKIARALRGEDALDQRAIDLRLLELDETENKSGLGANALLGASLGVLRAAAKSTGMPLYRYVGGSAARELPLPMVNILSGGLHVGGGSPSGLDLQDFLFLPIGAASYSQALEQSVAVRQAMKRVLKKHGRGVTGVADEGGFGPALESNEEGLKLMAEAFEEAGLEPGKEAAIGLDVAATHFYRDGHYHLAREETAYRAEELTDILCGWAERYPILSIEDGLAEDDWEGWRELTRRLGNRCQILGDDLFVTNRTRLEKGIKEGAANSVLVKMNQIGTMTETLDLVRAAQKHGYRPVISARSGETEDDTIADLAVATGAGQIKIGSVAGSERLAKYNRLLRIEEELGERALYRGPEVLAGWSGLHVKATHP